jgi:hypothetical protein
MSSVEIDLQLPAGDAATQEAAETKQQEQTAAQTDAGDIESPPQPTPRLAGTVSEMHVRTSQPMKTIQVDRHNSDPITTNERTQATKQHGNTPRSAWEKLRLPTPWGMVRLPSVREEFFCQVCFENVDVANAFTFAGNGGCAHKFCKDCLR